MYEVVESSTTQKIKGRDNSHRKTRRWVAKEKNKEEVNAFLDAKGSS